MDECTIETEDCKATGVETFEPNGVDHGDHGPPVNSPTARNTDVERRKAMNTVVLQNTEERSSKNGSQVNAPNGNRIVNEEHELNLNVKQLSSISPASSRRLCDMCGKLVSGRHDCVRKRLKEDPVQCPECGTRCSNRANLRRHMM